MTAPRHLRTGVGILTVVATLTALVGLSALFASDGYKEHSARVLVATYSVGMGGLGLALIWSALRRRARWAWISLWIYPLFFVAHVAALGIVVPDGVLAVLSAAGLVLARPHASEADHRHTTEQARPATTTVR